MFDPSIGRWMEEDPLGFQAQDTNLYRYVENDPTNAADPTGLAMTPTPSNGKTYSASNSSGQQISFTFDSSEVGSVRYMGLKAYAPCENDYFHKTHSLGYNQGDPGGAAFYGGAWRVEESDLGYYHTQGASRPVGESRGAKQPGMDGGHS